MQQIKIQRIWQKVVVVRKQCQAVRQRLRGRGGRIWNKGVVSTAKLGKLIHGSNAERRKIHETLLGTVQNRLNIAVHNNTAIDVAFEKIKELANNKIYNRFASGEISQSAFVAQVNKILGEKYKLS